jgi:hypothetical protein
MLDTVPKGVQLTDVITPLPVKPNSIKLIYDAATETIAFSGEVRVRDSFILICHLQPTSVVE